MQSHWTRIRARWTRTDTVVLGGNTAAFALLWANCRWQALAATYAGMLAPLALQLWHWRAVLPPHLGTALAAGALLGAAWPLGEWLVVNSLGWWGAYLAPGPRVLETPLYCMLIGWLATAHLGYCGLRIEELGYSRRTACVCTGLGAFAIGTIGENIFVSSGIWTYEPARWQVWQIPGFLPIAYGLGYAILPWTLRLGTARGMPLFLVWLLVCCAVLGVISGFFPR